MAYIEMKHCYKRYQVGDTEIVANRDVNFEIEKGELVIILGAVSYTHLDVYKRQILCSLYSRLGYTWSANRASFGKTRYQTQRNGLG